MTTGAENRQKIEDWLTSSRNSRRPLVVVGPSRCGKSELLTSVAEETGGALLLDCTGLTADEVGERIVAETGGTITPSGRRRPRRVLQTQLTGDHTVLLTNVQWAGSLASSTEPSRIARSLLRQLLWTPRASLRVAVEWDPEVLGPPPSPSTTISLEEVVGVPGKAGSPRDFSPVERALSATSWSELPITPAKATCGGSPATVTWYAAQYVRRAGVGGCAPAVRGRVTLPGRPAPMTPPSPRRPQVD